MVKLYIYEFQSLLLLSINDSAMVFVNTVKHFYETNIVESQLLSTILSILLC